MAWPGLLFDWNTDAFYMLQLWFYQMAVKHTDHALSFVPCLAVCTVPCGAVSRRVCMFAHGGSITPKTGSCPCRWKTRGSVKKQCVTVTDRFPMCEHCCNFTPGLCFSTGSPRGASEAISGWSAARTVKSLIVTPSVGSNKRRGRSDLSLALFSIGAASVQCQSHVHIASPFTGMLLSQLNSYNHIKYIKEWKAHLNLMKIQPFWGLPLNSTWTRAARCLFWETPHGSSGSTKPRVYRSAIEGSLGAQRCGRRQISGRPALADTTHETWLKQQDNAEYQSDDGAVDTADIWHCDVADVQQ